MTLKPDYQFGCYIIRDHLSQGGTGDVYRAENMQTSQRVALKIPVKSVIYDPRLYSFFLRELAALPQLNYPTIQRFIEADSFNGTPYLATAFIEGQSLRELLKEKGTLPIDQAVAIVQGVAEALDHCHGQGIIHRDLKPENILIAPDGQPILIDFGMAISKKRPASSVSGGTPEYMAPEQVQGKTEDWRVDLYQLGIMFYELLIGTTPFMDSDPLTSMNLRLHQAIPRIDRIRPELPRTVATVVARCLQVNPKQRYASMSALIVDLSRIDQVDTSDLDQLTQPPPNLSFWQTPPGQAIRMTLAFVVGIIIITLILVALKH